MTKTRNISPCHICGVKIGNYGCKNCNLKYCKKHRSILNDNLCKGCLSIKENYEKRVKSMENIIYGDD